MGAERRSMVMTEEEKKLTAYHEAGHAIVSLNIAESDPIHKATIIPRGRALGMVMRLPEQDRVSVSRVKLEADISVAAGGRIAEEMIFGHDKITAGAASDINQATKIAQWMVLECGMSEELGFLSYAEDDSGGGFLGYSTTVGRSISSSTAKVIDEEVRAIIDRNYERAKKILENNREELELLAQGLLEHETLSGEDIKKIIEGQKLEKQNKIEVMKASHKSKMPSSEYGDKTNEPPKKASTRKKTTPKN
jgi:cell division protease FtsH